MNIGEFARLGGVSIRMLRHYDALGLLRPEGVEPQSGYRQYGAAQLETLRRLLALRELGFTLEETRALLMDETDFVAALHARYAAVTADIGKLERQRAAIESRLAQLGKDFPMTHYDIQIQALPALHAASLRDPSLVLPESGGLDMSAMWALLYRQFPEAVQESDTTVIWHDQGEQLPEPELLHPVQPGTVVPAPFVPRDLLPISRAATLTYQGHYADRGLADAFAAIYQYGEDSAHLVVGSVRQVFRGGQLGAGREIFEIELQLPLL